jgi:hypothetical protein
MRDCRGIKVDDYYTQEHIRMAAILNVQWTRAVERDPNAMLTKTKWAREAINSIIIDVAVMYRDINPRFDFPRFVRESRQGAE